MCGLCQHIVRPPPSPIFGSLPWQFTFAHPLLGHTWTKHSSRMVRRLSPTDVSFPRRRESSDAPWRRVPIAPWDGHEHSVVRVQALA
ncbi:hypothetical protein GW17_00017328 [Ensete ventricosum]|nr:hypothetical protein GW17_00017328 [Ensete ventricosum]